MPIDCTCYANRLLTVTEADFIIFSKCKSIAPLCKSIAHCTKDKNLQIFKYESLFSKLQNQLHSKPETYHCIYSMRSFLYITTNNRNTTTTLIMSIFTSIDKPHQSNKRDKSHTITIPNSTITHHYTTL